MNHTQQSLRRDALAFTELLAEQYFVRRELNALPQYLDEHISWIGTGSDEISRNLAEAQQALLRELAEYSGAFTVAEHSFEAVPRSDTLCVVYGTVRAVPEDASLAEQNLRLSLFIEKTLQGMRLVHLHLSHPDQDQESGHYYVPKAARNNTQALRHTLELRSRQLEILNRNIPGGAHQCKNDAHFTILSMSDSFLSMFGYTREEIGTLFHNHFVEMIHPADRSAVLSAARKQMKHGRDLELEYRVLCKNGTAVWILDKARLLEDGSGCEIFYCLMMEITQRKQAQEALRLSLERYQVIMNQATDVIFEWDIHKDTLIFSSNWNKKFGYAPISSDISTRIPLSNHIHPDDMPVFVQLMQDTAAGTPYSETEFRIQEASGCYNWCRIRATTQFDGDGHPIKAVGVIVDIDHEKKQKQLLLDLAQKDALTGLYNKAAIRSLVERRMAEPVPGAIQALLIVDVDHFKAVNDTYGHPTGDSVLSYVAATLKAHIRTTDFAGRIGGDEFLVYLPEVSGEAAAHAKAEELLAALALLVPRTGAPPISCSIGGAVFPYGCIDYTGFYKCADLALYARKKSGRAGVSFYQPEESEHPACGAPASAVGENVDTLDGSVIDDQLAQYAFRRLYAAQDIGCMLERLLEIIGRSYDVSRAYIFEFSADGTHCANTFEWCADGITPQKDALQHQPCRDASGNIIRNFDAQGLFCCTEEQEAHPFVRAAMETQHIRSLLQCAMLDEGRVVGYVGFDECRENRAWSQRQIAAFKLTADVLSSFVIRLRQKQALSRQEK